MSSIWLHANFVLAALPACRAGIWAGDKLTNCSCQCTLRVAGGLPPLGGAVRFATGNGRHDHNLYGKLLQKVAATAVLPVVVVVFLC